MAAGREDRSIQMKQPLLVERDESFTFPSSLPNSQSVTVDVGEYTGSVFDSKTFQGESLNNGPYAPCTTPGHFRSSSAGVSRDTIGDDSSDGIEGEHVKKRVDPKQKALRSKRRRSLRNPKSLMKQAAHSASNDPIYFLKNVIRGILLWPKWAWNSMASQKNLTVISLKSGIAAGLVSIICVVHFPPPYDELSSIAIWAVVTIDILYEGNIGLSLMKGVNRVAGTLCAGTAAVCLTQLGPDVPEHLYPYYTVFWVFLGGFVFRYLKGIPPLKDQWGYAFTVATIAFHILLLSSYLQPEKVTLPILRFSMILLGFFLASIINLSFMPVYAGDTLHSLVAKNFDAAGAILLRCVTEYSNYTMLDHVPDILSGCSEDDKIHQSYHEIVMSDSDIDKLLGAVLWEPCHGAFFNGYPWHLYDDITDYLRYTLYDVIALDSCLRASIQAPKNLRDLFTQEMKEIAEECSKVLGLLGESMRNMTKVGSEDLLCRAEEAAIELQNKIYIHTHLLLGKGAAESPRYGLYLASCYGNPDAEQRDASDVVQRVYDPNDPWATSEAEQFQSYEDRENFASARTRSKEIENGDEESAPLVVPTQNGHDTRLGEDYISLDNRYETEHAVLSSWQDSPHLSRCNSTQLSRNGSGETVDVFPRGGLSRGLSDERRQHSQSLPENIQVDDGSGVGEAPKPQTKVKTKMRGSEKLQQTSWKHTFKSRRSNLGTDYDGAEERISALSLVKFASLLIEIVAKMKYVVTSVQELGEAAKFKTQNVESFESSLRAGIPDIRT
ncbi:aluminum-activated malate transporter family protein [Marchantia polymorpha subsp. ruderalis]|uniref:Uncharacterized protein n=2 Tax=Marchantia polymorpha TaxID=3197 RepID=A0AAF6B9X4_MARPO|nr:hypothetical protein MARPO_0070s0016 [Marchantia polymorpha]BBN08808.1 hypothetical protein Mp_4g14650 [Marchantia polymorpha subsp. ruderalis]|eukprot:PTQ35544.1 hypothetical protein MARPO_0070s0016 [Marchantia polymorpha]